MWKFQHWRASQRRKGSCHTVESKSWYCRCSASTTSRTTNEVKNKPAKASQNETQSMDLCSKPGVFHRAVVILLVWDACGRHNNSNIFRKMSNAASAYWYVAVFSHAKMMYSQVHYYMYRWSAERVLVREFMLQRGRPRVLKQAVSVRQTYRVPITTALKMLKKGEAKHWRAARTVATRYEAAETSRVILLGNDKPDSPATIITICPPRLWGLDMGSPTAAVLLVSAKRGLLVL